MEINKQNWRLFGSSKTLNKKKLICCFKKNKIEHLILVLTLKSFLKCYLNVGLSLVLPISKPYSFYFDTFFKIEKAFRLKLKRIFGSMYIIHFLGWRNYYSLLIGYNDIVGVCIKIVFHFILSYFSCL